MLQTAKDLDITKDIVSYQKIVKWNYAQHMYYVLYLPLTASVRRCMERT